jgi:hypothetical protein
MPRHARNTIRIRWAALTLLMLALIGFGVYATRDTRKPGIWTKTSPDTLEFDGEIWAGTETAFLEIVTPETRRLVVRSGGGDSFVALSVANYILDHHLNLEVKEYCYSSCANYWFTAANKKVIPQGAVLGFHGDPLTSLQYQENIEPAMLDDIHKFDIKAQVFYKKIGLHPSLFSHSVAFTNANPVGLWAPSPKELECAGVKNLEMWFPKSEADYNLGDFAQADTIGTSAHDVRKLKPDFCQQIKSGS